MKTVGVISVFFMLNLFSFYGFAQNCPELTGVYDCDKRESSEWKYDYIIFTQKDIETETRRNLKYTQYSIKPTRFPESLENHRQGEVRLTDGRQRTAGHISYYDSESGNEKRFTVSYKATCKKSEAGLPQLWIQDSIPSNDTLNYAEQYIFEKTDAETLVIHMNSKMQRKDSEPQITEISSQCKLKDAQPR